METPGYADRPSEQRKPVPGFRKLMVAVDFSQSSIAALSYAEHLAKAQGSDLILAHVASSMTGFSTDPEPLFMPPETGQNMAETLEHFANNLMASGVNARTIIREGLVADALEEIVQTEKPDLLVVGTHGAHGLERLIIGSSAESILRRVSSPVLTIGPECKNVTRTKVTLQTILYVTVLRHASEAALLYVASLARTTHAHVDITHAIEENYELASQTVDLELQSQAHTLAGLLVRGSDGQVSAHRVYGEPVEAIIHRALKIQADWIVLGVERGGPLSSFLPAGVAYRLVCAAPCPVLTLKKEDPIHSR